MQREPMVESDLRRITPLEGSGCNGTNGGSIVFLLNCHVTRNTLLLTVRKLYWLSWQIDLVQNSLSLLVMVPYLTPLCRDLIFKRSYLRRNLDGTLFVAASWNVCGISRE
jgi:hypothetical protein